MFKQDVENYDPILNPVLNRELRRTGGRVLITLGDQDIDLSPSFVIFLSTRYVLSWTRIFLFTFSWNTQLITVCLKGPDGGVPSGHVLPSDFRQLHGDALVATVAVLASRT